MTKLTPPPPPSITSGRPLWGCLYGGELAQVPKLAYFAQIQARNISNVYDTSGLVVLNIQSRAERE